MDEKLSTPNLAGAVDQAPGIRPEDLQAGSAGVEGLPQPGSGPSAQVQATQTASPLKLSADDVAAAISSTAKDPTSNASAIPAPNLAGDVDVIEPEWVNKAESVVKEHSGDPYGEENAIEDLQQDYLKKRYNYDVANPNTDSSKPERT